MKNGKFSLVASVAGMMILTSACGAQKYSTGAADSLTSGSSTNPYTVVPTPVPSILPTPVPSSTPTNLLPPETYSFKVNGPNGAIKSQVFPATSTDNILKVTVITNSYGSVEGSNQSVGYNCVQYNVTVRPQGATSGGSTKQAFVSLTGQPGTGKCQGALAQPVLDFSSTLTTGHGAMEVSIAATNSDNCRKYHWNNYYGWIYGAPTDYETYYGQVSNPVVYGIGYAGCSLDVIYDTYNVVGSVQIHTNGTE